MVMDYMDLTVEEYNQNPSGFYNRYLNKTVNIQQASKEIQTRAEKICTKDDIYTACSSSDDDYASYIKPKHKLKIAKVSLTRLNNPAAKRSKTVDRNVISKKSSLHITRLCKICGDQATGEYLGIQACASCQHFYKKYSSNSLNSLFKSLTCINNTGKCIIDKKLSQTLCLKCKFDKFDKLILKS
jgi:hypothetical protein